MTRLKVVSFDLDSTIAWTEHRWSMIDREADNGPDFWDSYSLACPNDTPGPALPLAQYFTQHELPFIVVSGRSEIARECTMEWLYKHGVKPWATFLCDDRHNYMGHGEWKALRLKEIAETNNWDIVLHVDDISDVAVHTAAIGIPTLLVHTIGALADHLG